MTDSIIEEIKARLKLVELVAKSFEVTGRGRVLSTKEHDSLKLWPEQGRWWWFAQGVGGDVLDWYRHVNRCDLGRAIEELSRLAGIERRPVTAEEMERRTAAARQAAVLATAAQWFQAALWGPDGQAAREYCAGRGWTPETMKREGIGCNPVPNPEPGTSDNKSLSAVLREAGLMDEHVARAVLTMPQGMLIYVHRDHGQPVYLSGRSLVGKRHWNLPADKVGGKQLYTNEAEGKASGVTTLVEGQADAIALGQLGVPAVALCGLAGADVRAVGISHVMLDNDEKGLAKALEVATAIDPMVRVVKLPEGVKDAAEGLQAHCGPELLEAIDGAPMALMVLAERAGKTRGEKRQAALDEFFRRYEALEEVVATDLKPELAKALCSGIGQFNRLHKAYEKAHQEARDNPDRYEHTCGQVRGGYVFEQCVVRNADGQCQVMFAVRKPDGKFEMQKAVTVGGVCYLPYPGNTAVIDKQVVLFPERLEDYRSVGQLVGEVRAFIHKYLDIDPFYEKLAAYYVLFTWVYDIFENVPYIRALGDYGTGKTRFLQAIGATCYRPMFVSGATTVSPIFRLLHMFRGTLIIDEADFANSDAEAEIIKILNVGYYRGGVVLRSEKDPNSDEYFPSVSEVFGPKILATRKPFSDRATESRCLTKRMATRRPRPGIPYTVSGEFWAEAARLRNKLLMYRLKTHRPVTVDQSLADESVEPRLNQITMALKTIVEDGVMRQEIDTFIRAYNDLLIGERQLTLPAIVVQAVVAIFYTKGQNLLGEDTRDLSMKGIADKALGILQDIDGEAKLTPRRVSVVLNEELGLTKRRMDNKTNRSVLVCDDEELVALMQRYGINPPQAEEV